MKFSAFDWLHHNETQIKKKKENTNAADLFREGGCKGKGRLQRCPRIEKVYEAICHWYREDANKNWLISYEGKLSIKASFKDTGARFP